MDHENDNNDISEDELNSLDFNDPISPAILKRKKYEKNIEQSESEAHKQGNLLGDVIKLVSGTGAGIVITGLSTLLLSRAYSVEAFGVFGIYASIITILTIIACSQFELTINLPTSHEDGVNQLAISVISCGIVSILIVPLIWFFGKDLALFFKEPGLTPYLWLLPVNTFLSGFSIALNYWNSRTHKFGRLSIITVINTAVTALGQIGLSFRPNAGAGELILGSIIGIFCATSLLTFRVWSEDSVFIMNNVKWAKIHDGIIRYKKFPLLNTWSNLINSFSWQLPTFMLTRFFSTTVTGYYNLGTRVMRVPMSLLGGAIAKAQYPRLAQAKHKGKLTQMVEKTVQMLIAYSMFPMLILTLVGEESFIVLFGRKWAEAGFYTQILSLWTLFWFISSPISRVLDILEKQYLLLRINIIVFITRLASLWIGGIMAQPRLAILLFAISGILAYGYYSLVIIRVSGVPLLNVLKFLGKYFLIFLPFGLVLGVLKWISIAPWVLLLIAIIFLLSYYFYLVKTDEMMMNSLRPFLIKIFRKPGNEKP